MQQISLFGPKEPEAQTREPIKFEDAKYLNGADAQRILCGEPREVVVAEAKQRYAEWLARKQRSLQPASETRKGAWYFNLTPHPVSFRTEHWTVTVCSQDGILFLHGEQRHEGAAALCGATEAVEAVRSGGVELTPRLAVAFRTAGVQP